MAEGASWLGRRISPRFPKVPAMRFRLWPATSFEIHTPFAPEKVFGILQANTEARRFFRGWGDHLYFEGECSIEGFKISRIIQYRNSFLPVITGRITPEGAGSLVKIKMRLPVFASVFMTFWFGCVILFSLGSIPGFFAGLANVDSGALFPLGMVAFGIALTSGGFWFEAPKQKNKLTELLKP
jgi:hypothetical protein